MKTIPEWNVIGFNHGIQMVNDDTTFSITMPVSSGNNIEINAQQAYGISST